MVHLGAQAVAEHRRTRSASSRPAPATTWPATSTSRARTRVAAADRVIASQPAARSTWRAAGDSTSSTVLAAGFDAIVNERANRMTWPRGQMRYNLATLAELRTFEPAALHARARRRTRRLDAMLVAVGNGPSFGGGLRITEGAVARRRPARRGDHQADEQGRSWSAPTRSCSRAPTCTHPQYEHHRVRTVTVAAPGIVVVRRRRAVRPAAADRRVRPGALSVLA